jgi:two-component system, NtrC family, sensor kinase
MKKNPTKSIQSQLILYFTIAILVPTTITMMVGVKFIYDQIIRHAETKTISDLNSAHEIYRNRITQIESITRLTAARSLIKEAIIKHDRKFLQKDLNITLRREKLDIFTLVDVQGKVTCRGRNDSFYGDNYSDDKFVQRVVSTKIIISGTDIIPREKLLLESPELADQALMKITETPKAKPPQEPEKTSGMMLKAAVPVFDDDQNMLGILIGGILVDRNYDVVDKIKEIVHEKGIYKGNEIGTATIFLNDVRISTNVKNQDGSRAISTLVSEEVYDTVLKQGRRFVGEAFVVNAWYISAYEPIRDIDGFTIGLLYVGVLKQPYDDILKNTLITFLGIALVGIILIILISIYQAKKISKPLKQLEEIAKIIADGDYKHELVIKAPREIEHLASSLNQMAKELEKEKKELEEWGKTLEIKVNDRTDEIKKIHAQLFRSEKLASIGKLAAGVAHEINNPLTGILTNASLLLEDLPVDDPRHEDADVIVRETIRCREIVKRLLDFARQTKPLKQTTNINTIIDNIIFLVRNQASFRNISIVKNLTDNLPMIMADTDQIQQVFINIILNAAEAMPKGGTLDITSNLLSKSDQIEIKFTDSGIGISEEVKEKIFDPFFTTKDQGTGLGLSISYGIIEQHGGTINVESKKGIGSTFTILLPVNSIENE